MNKLEALQQLLERVQDPDSLIINTYIKKHEDNTVCFCAVGHLLDIGQCDFTPLLEDDDLNSKAIRGIMSDEPEITRSLVDMGFTGAELKAIQIYNDSENHTGLVRYIKTLIKENGGNVNE